MLREKYSSSIFLALVFVGLAGNNSQAGDQNWGKVFAPLFVMDVVLLWCSRTEFGGWRNNPRPTLRVLFIITMKVLFQALLVRKLNGSSSLTYSKISIPLLIMLAVFTVYVGKAIGKTIPEGDPRTPSLCCPLPPPPPLLPPWEIVHRDARK